jgi:Na+/proline symporter
LVAFNWGVGAERWRLNKPFYPAFMIFIAVFPFVVAHALVRTKSGQSVRASAIWSFAVWAVVALYVAFVFGWMSTPVYRAWEKLI